MSNTLLHLSAVKRMSEFMVSSNDRIINQKVFSINRYVYDKLSDNGFILETSFLQDITYELNRYPSGEVLEKNVSIKRRLHNPLIQASGSRYWTMSLSKSKVTSGLDISLEDVSSIRSNVHNTLLFINHVFNFENDANLLRMFEDFDSAVSAKLITMERIRLNNKVVKNGEDTGYQSVVGSSSSEQKKTFEELLYPYSTLYVKLKTDGIAEGSRYSYRNGSPLTRTTIENYSKKKLFNSLVWSATNPKYHYRSAYYPLLHRDFNDMCAASTLRITINKVSKHFVWFFEENKPLPQSLIDKNVEVWEILNPRPAAPYAGDAETVRACTVQAQANRLIENRLNIEESKLIQYKGKNFLSHKVKRDLFTDCFGAANSHALVKDFNTTGGSITPLNYTDSFSLHKEKLAFIDTPTTRVDRDRKEEDKRWKIVLD